MSPSTNTSTVGLRNRPVPPAVSNGLRLAPGVAPWRKPPVVAGVLLVLVCAIAFGLASLRMGDRRVVLATTRTLPAGHVLSRSDIKELSIGGDTGVVTIPAADVGRVVGRSLSAPLIAGSILSPAQFGAPSGLMPGEASVGLALKAGQFPADLAPGGRVRVLDAGAPAAGTLAATPAVMARSATVTAVSAPDVGGATVVSIKVASADADRVAAAAASGHAVLVGLAEGS